MGRISTERHSCWLHKPFSLRGLEGLTGSIIDGSRWSARCLPVLGLPHHLILAIPLGRRMSPPPSRAIWGSTHQLIQLPFDVDGGSVDSRPDMLQENCAQTHYTALSHGNHKRPANFFLFFLNYEVASLDFKLNVGCQVWDQSSEMIVRSIAIQYPLSLQRRMLKAWRYLANLKISFIFLTHYNWMQFKPIM